MTVATTTPDAFLERCGLSGAFNFMNIDVQGAEMLALREAVRLLSASDALDIEINLAEMYEGCPWLDDVDDFLRTFGFIRTETFFEHKWRGNAFCVRRFLLDALA